MGTHDVHQQPSRRGRRIFDPVENGPPHLHSASTDPELLCRENASTAASSLPQIALGAQPLSPATTESTTLSSMPLPFFNPLLQLYQNPLFQANFLANAVKGEAIHRAPAVPEVFASILKLLPLNGNLNKSSELGDVNES